MSRLESNAEPSMEEILASIRKIIAEDSSGMRPASVPPRPGTPYSPAPKAAAPQPSPSASPAPQRGFMSREAFLKSSQPAEPEPRRETLSPISTPRPSGGNSGSLSPASRLQPRDDTPSFARPSRSLRERELASSAKDPARGPDDMRSKEPVLPGTAKDDAKPLKLEVSEPTRPADQRSGTIAADSGRVVPDVETSTAETIEVVAIEDALPVIKEVIKEGAPSVLKAQAEPAASPSSKSDAASIEAQLTELLSEDLNALRQGRAKLDEPAVAFPEALDDVPAEPENSDPFAFDLGPSPFAPKSEPQRSAPSSASGAESSPPANSVSAVKLEPAKPAPEPAPAQSHQPVPAEEQPGAPAQPNAPEPGIFTKNVPQNGPYFGPFVPGIFAAPVSPATGDAQHPKSEAEAAAQRQRQSFVVPSVSATLGPTRKLEPLSNAFQPAPVPPPVLETFSPAPETAPEPPRAPQAPAGRLEDPRPVEPQPSSEPRLSHGEHQEADQRTTLPATFDSSFDRPMEDAVADLLRPLLKTWLAENMPKIVERALRREMSERLLPGQKNSRE